MPCGAERAGPYPKSPWIHQRALSGIYKGRWAIYSNGCSGFSFENERIKTVVTDQGTFDCDKLVLTAGIWSKPLMGKLGLNVPLETERGYHVVYKNPSLVPKHPMMMTVGKFAVTPMSDGLRCAGTVEFGGIKLVPSSGR